MRSETPWWHFWDPGGGGVGGALCAVMLIGVPVCIVLGLTVQ